MKNFFVTVWHLALVAGSVWLIGKYPTLAPVIASTGIAGAAVAPSVLPAVNRASSTTTK